MRRQSSRDEARQPPQPMRRKNSDEDLSAAFGRLGTASPSAVAYDGGSTSYATGSGSGGAGNYAAMRPPSAPSDKSSTRRRRRDEFSNWAERSVTTALGAARGFEASKEHEKLYRATLQAVVDGLIIGRGGHGVVLALSNDKADPRFSLAVKVIHKEFTTSKGKEPSFHRTVAHPLHLQNEVAAMAKLSSTSNFILPLYCAFQDDLYVYLVCERGCCTLKQLIQHSHEDELQQLLAFQQAQPLKFLSFCMLMSLSMLHACWALQRARLIHHDIHPAQILVTADGRPRLSDLGQCSVIAVDQRKQLLPPLGRRDFCRCARPRTVASPPPAPPRLVPLVPFARPWGRGGRASAHDANP